MRRTQAAIFVAASVIAISVDVHAQGTRQRVREDTAVVLDRITVTSTAPRPQNDRETLLAERRSSRDSLLHDLDLARARWSQHQPVRIRYRLRYACGCVMAVAASRDVAVEVAGDSLATIRNDSASTRDSSATRYLFSVSYLFELAEQAIRGNAEHIIVAFDPILGVPTRVLVDERVNTTDDEDSFVISDIVVVR